MKLVCIGVGGTGAASLETLIHLAAVGLFPEGCEIVPVVLDPDQGHPRVTGVTGFLSSYNELRARTKANDLNVGGLFGTRIIRESGVNALKPAHHENLFGLLGLARPDARPVARLFFEAAEIGDPESHEFANGYYGRANAGVCFFSDPAGRQELMAALRAHLRGGQSKLVLFGSVFGGTGAAGLLHVARTVREDPELRAAVPPIAVVPLESYFEPDPSRADSRAGFINLPETFQRRTGAAYQFLANLALNRNLPFQVLYPLGTRNPTIFPPDWFKRDQQDNPHLFIEYLAALAARDFCVNGPERGEAEARSEVRIRRVAVPPYGDPLSLLRDALHDAAYTYQLLSSYVLPLLLGCSGEYFPGHPWIHDVRTESGVGMIELRDQAARTLGLLKQILGHAGILESDWRLEAQAGRSQSSEDISDEQRVRAGLMNQLTRASFPENFIPYLERVDLSAVFATSSPADIFGSYSRAADAQLPVRALFRWVRDSRPAFAADRVHVPSQIDYQLVQQEDIPDQTGQVLNIASGTITDDGFHGVAPEYILPRLARASWKSPAGQLRRSATECPSIWAPALIHAERVLRAEDGRLKYVHLGLLWIATIAAEDRTDVPVYEVSLDTTRLSAALQNALKSTCPLPNYTDAMVSSGNLLVLHRPDVPLTAGETPAAESVLGFFYPDTIVVPAAGLDSDTLEMLYQLGRFASGRRLPILLTEICRDWAGTLGMCGVPNADIRGAQFERFLASFNDTVHPQPVTAAEMYSRFPVNGAAGWVRHIYGQGVQA